MERTIQGSYVGSPGDMEELMELVRANKIDPIHEAKWALLDYGDLIVNIFQPEIRKYYDLESFWSNGDNLLFP